MDHETTDAYASLTKHPEGSVRELWSLSFPLMLSFISGNLMLFLDRLILANYSTEAMNAAVTTGMANAVFHFAAIGVASIAEVFVGQHNGAKRYGKIGEPVWQMIWFSLATSVVFVPLGLLGADLFSPGEQYGTLASHYFRTLMLFGPVFPLFAAVSGFFIGIGRVRLVTVTTISINLLNILLDILFIFGVEGWFSPMATLGAALATGISQLTGVAVLVIAFLGQDNRKRYGTGCYNFVSSSFWKCIRVGGPNAVGHMIEVAAWAGLLRIIAGVGDFHLTVYAVGQSLVILVMFANQGLEKGLTTIAANYIGAKKWGHVSKVLRSAVVIQLLIAAACAVVLLGYPDPLINGFLAEETIEAPTAELVDGVKRTCIWVVGFILFDGLTWLFAGVLTSAGDTKFVMVMNAVAAWLFAMLPFYVALTIYGGSPQVAWMMTACYAMLNSISFYLRYRSGKWKDLAITEES